MEAVVGLEYEVGRADIQYDEVRLMSDQEKVKMRLEVCLAEYDKLKSEQAQRIGHRDSLVYATLVATAGVIAFAWNKDGDPIGLMVLPLACFVLGWLHTINDEKISSIGLYLRTTLRERIGELTDDKHPCILGWEGAVRTSRHRRWRKIVQLISNLVTFVAPGALALPTYWYLEGAASWVLIAATSVESILLLVLTCEIIREADVGLVGSFFRRPKATGQPLLKQAEAPNPGHQADG